MHLVKLIILTDRLINQANYFTRSSWKKACNMRLGITIWAYINVYLLSDVLVRLEFKFKLLIIGNVYNIQSSRNIYGIWKVRRLFRQSSYWSLSRFHNLTDQEWFPFIDHQALGLCLYIHTYRCDRRDLHRYLFGVVWTGNRENCFHWLFLALGSCLGCLGLSLGRAQFSGLLGGYGAGTLFARLLEFGLLGQIV